jgi:hypothetical protein
MVYIVICALGQVWNVKEYERKKRWENYRTLWNIIEHCGFVWGKAKAKERKHGGHDREGRDSQENGRKRKRRYRLTGKRTTG